MTDKTNLPYTTQLEFIKAVEGACKQLQSLTLTMQTTIEEYIEGYNLDNDIAKALQRLIDHTSHIIPDVTTALHDSELCDIIERHEAANANGCEYMSDSLNDPDRNTYGD